MITKAATLFGVIFIIVGILGFVPGAAPDGHLLGIFHINTAHNLVHLLSGAVALVCSRNGEQASRIFFLSFGVIYGLVSILGFIKGDEPLLGIIANNLADAFLHLGIAVVSLGLGFLPQRTLTTTASL
jgi:hypothetical protein